MFKMGGSAGTGITSGLDKPRQNYQKAGSVNPLQQYPTDFFPTLGTRETKQDDTQFNLSDLTNLLGDKKEEKFKKQLQEEVSWLLQQKLLKNQLKHYLLNKLQTKLLKEILN